MADDLEELLKQIGILTREVDFWRGTSKLANARADSTAAELKSTEEENDTLYTIVDAWAKRYGDLLHVLNVPIAGTQHDKAIEAAKNLVDEHEFWHRKAGEEHARCIELERELAALRTQTPNDGVW